MPTIQEYAKYNKIKLRDAYRLVEQGKLKVHKELREIPFKKKVWVLCIDETESNA